VRTPQPYDAWRCRPLLDELAARRIWQTPTLAFFRALPDVFSGKPMPHAEIRRARSIHEGLLRVLQRVGWLDA
jgi:hypothetical protein